MKKLFIISIACLIAAMAVVPGLYSYYSSSESFGSGIRGMEIDYFLAKTRISSIVEQDTAVENRIEYIRQIGTDYEVKTSIKDRDVQIQLFVFNMIGKIVLEIHEGFPVPGDEYLIDGSKLPQGIYICVLQGRNFRDTEKFVVSR